MGCAYLPNCGGCCFRDLTLEQYRQEKEQRVRNILAKGLVDKEFLWEEPIFLDDGSRRRAALAFSYSRKKITLGFNAENSREILDCRQCFMLTKAINDILDPLRSFLEKLCEIKICERCKSKAVVKSIQKGDVLILEADNGLDIVLETDLELGLDHRMEIFDFMSAQESVIRFSYRRGNSDEAEPIVEKLKPIVKIGGYDVFVAQGMFLQASKAGEQALVSTVERYLGDMSGAVADLFCGIGTFSYPLSVRAAKVVSVDLNEGLLNGFRDSVHRQMLHNIEIRRQNLFKYPLEAEELAQFDVVVFDPPRAGAAAQVRALVKAAEFSRPARIIAVSCNPHSFVNDANVLINGGFKLQKVTMVDQFVYSNHSELVALFTK